MFLPRVEKKKIRELFYKIMYDNNFSIDIFYFIIESLRPQYINVIARRGRDIYRAPILASRTKSVMKAIKFFKKSVMARLDDSLEEKIANEILDYLFWNGYKNAPFEEYTALSRRSKHLRHFRSKKIY